MPFSRAIFEQFAQLVNQMLTDALNGLIHHSLQSCTNRFSQWMGDAHRSAPPLFHVCLDAVELAVTFSPPLEDFAEAVHDTLTELLRDLAQTKGNNAAGYHWILEELGSFCSSITQVYIKILDVSISHLECLLAPRGNTLYYLPLRPLSAPWRAHL
jgi:hypothetical protein